MLESEQSLDSDMGVRIILIYCTLASAPLRLSSFFLHSEMSEEDEGSGDLLFKGLSIAFEFDYSVRYSEKTTLKKLVQGLGAHVGILGKNVVLLYLFCTDVADSFSCCWRTTAQKQEF